MHAPQHLRPPAVIPCKRGDPPALPPAARRRVLLIN